MKSKLAIVASAIFVFNVLGAGVVAASSPHGTPPVHPAPHHAAPHHAPSFSAHCSGAHPGGTIKIKAKVKHAVRGKTLTGTASAVFTTGLAAVDLQRRGHSFKLHGKLPVPSTQPTGPVSVTVTITYDGQTTILNCTSRIHPKHPPKP